MFPGDYVSALDALPYFKYSASFSRRRRAEMGARRRGGGEWGRGHRIIGRLRKNPFWITSMVVLSSIHAAYLGHDPPRGYRNRHREPACGHYRKFVPSPLNPH